MSLLLDWMPLFSVLERYSLIRHPLLLILKRRPIGGWTLTLAVGKAATNWAATYGCFDGTSLAFGHFACIASPIIIRIQYIHFIDKALMVLTPSAAETKT